MNTIILDCRPIQKGDYNGVNIVAINWFENIIKNNTGSKIILWTNSRKKIDPIHLKNLLKLSCTEHIHTRYSNLLLTIMFTYTNLLSIEKLLKLSQCQSYYCPDLRAFNTKAKTNIYIHDLAYLKYPKFYSLKSRLNFKLINPVKTCQKADKIYTNSKFSKSQIYQLLKTTKSKIKIFTPSISKIDFTENITQKKQFLVLGDFQPRKRTKTIIKAFKQIQKHLPEHQLILVGKSDSAFAKYNIQTNQKIKIYSNLSQIDKTKLILESKALIYIPVFEGFGLPVLEAITYKKPIICSRLKVFKQNFKQYPIYVSNLKQLKTELLKFK